MELAGRLGLGLLISAAYWAIFVVATFLLFKFIYFIRSFWSPPRAYDPSQAARIRGRMRRMARPTLLLTPTQTPGFSKLGGEPEMSRGASWPTGERDGPLAFIAQLDLSEVRSAGGPEWLPEKGALHFFNDDLRYGFPDHFRVLFSPEGERTAFPFPPELHQRNRFGERRVGFLQMTSVPSLDWLGVWPADLNIGDAELDELIEAPDAEFGDELQHRVGGYPAEIQNSEMPLECEHLARGLTMDYKAEVPDAVRRASRSWRLLLQVDSDPALGMSWGDAGRLYVFIREQHARAGKFSKTVSLWQTY
jgi:uncharacterized protein YwqG